MVDDTHTRKTSGKLSLLALLDLLSAFDIVDHEILRDLEVSCGLQGTALSWFTSYLNGHTWFIRCTASTSNHALLGCGVRQGSVLGPISSMLYTEGWPRAAHWKFWLAPAPLRWWHSGVRLYCSNTVRAPAAANVLLHWQRSGVAAVKQTPAQCSQDWVFMKFVGSTTGSGPIDPDSRWDWFYQSCVISP